MRVHIQKVLQQLEEIYEHIFSKCIQETSCEYTTTLSNMLSWDFLIPRFLFYIIVVFKKKIVHLQLQLSVSANKTTWVLVKEATAYSLQSRF